ncbi:ORF30 [Bovine gammaherpesvirus 6]|uniref:ORF30 n=1 Tax=Bovine gammaherpesvirus 6 TaxID=1504288 RepID=A0A060CXJ7_9GAMA|nr:ORF30 [Bovine gammaherpesvirus 6]AIB03183.1 ORF30 [Bovine gammaherpesvirus 6]
MRERLTEADFEACLKFFNRPFPEAIAACASNLAGLRKTEGHTQHLELVALILDLTGTECVQEIVKLNRQSGGGKPTAATSFK